MLTVAEPLLFAGCGLVDIGATPLTTAEPEIELEGCPPADAAEPAAVADAGVKLAVVADAEVEPLAPLGTWSGPPQAVTESERPMSAAH
jgi:hypothetical protein